MDGRASGKDLHIRKVKWKSEGVKEHCRDAAMTLVIETQGTKRNTKRPQN